MGSGVGRVTATDRASVVGKEGRTQKFEDRSILPPAGVDGGNVHLAASDSRTRLTVARIEELS